MRKVIAAFLLVIHVLGGLVLGVFVAGGAGTIASVGWTRASELFARGDVGEGALVDAFLVVGVPLIAGLSILLWAYLTQAFGLLSVDELRSWIRR